MRTQLPLALLAAAFAGFLAAGPAHARARVFVASYGNDSNPCTFGSPCKTFQQAVNVVDAGGEVTAIDSAGFGPINITKAVTITSPNGVEAGIVAAAGGNAITISAGATDAIVLGGLTLDGSGVAYNGVVFNSGGSLTVTNCVVQNFFYNGIGVVTGNGIFIQPTSGKVHVTITNTIAQNNQDIGILWDNESGSPSVSISIDHVVATNNGAGLYFAGGVTGATADISISNSIASDNAQGIAAGSGNALTVSIDNSTIRGNSSWGIAGFQPASILLTRSVIQGNGTGIENDTNPSTFYTYGNNLIDLNGQNFSGTALNSSVKLR